MRTMTTRLALCVALAASSFLAHAQFELDSSESSLNFISIKNGAVGEVHSFSSIAGGIGESGEATVVVDLDSVETLIPIRNERMREMLFKTASFPEATVSAQVDPTVLEAAGEGGVLQVELPLQVSLHGVDANLTASLTVVGEGNGRVRVFSARPLLVNAASFDLEPGIEALRGIAGLSAISTSVPVTLQLLFVPSKE